MYVAQAYTLVRRATRTSNTWQNIYILVFEERSFKKTNAYCISLPPPLCRLSSTRTRVQLHSYFRGVPFGFRLESVFIQTRDNAFLLIQKQIKWKIPSRPKISLILCPLYLGFFLYFELPRILRSSLLRSPRRHLFDIQLLRPLSR